MYDRGIYVAESLSDTGNPCYDPDYNPDDRLVGVSYSVSQALEDRNVDILSYSNDTASSSKCSVSDTIT
jgi:hypothetical protein